MATNCAIIVPLTTLPKLPALITTIPVRKGALGGQGPLNSVFLSARFLSQPGGAVESPRLGAVKLGVGVLSQTLQATPSLRTSTCLRGGRGQ